MSHPDYSAVLCVGCNCAEKMTTDYETPREQEREMQNRAHRRVNFLGALKYYVDVDTL